ncbi:GSU2403 family nucleotidyltransferase fold protein [Sphingomonas immobilis]|nr:GSU2403 family nucleotidyltransferase fold protein [Sphingomonas sp. CA1-15]
MRTVTPFTEEQARLLVNLHQRYDAWMSAEQTLHQMPYDLRRKEVAGKAYLYEIHDRGGNGKSLGPWSAAQEARFGAYRAAKADAKLRRDGAAGTLAESARLYRALRLPMLASAAGPILREADRRSLLGSDLLVIGTNATTAYAIEANGFIRQLPDETEDLDLAWAAEREAEDQRVWDLLKTVDPTFTVNTERTFQARNAKAYEVEILVAPSRAGTMARADRPRPVPLPEQEWLLLGTPVSHVVVCRDGSPARIIAPDPRWFALQKLWMAEQKKRNPQKRPKDHKQGMLLLDAVAEAMPQYPLDAGFEAQLPGELAPFFAAWSAQRPPPVLPSW